LAAGNDTKADRNTYTQQARDEIQEWQRKLHDFSERAEAKGKEAANAAENDLNKAWTKAEAASRQLQTVGAEGSERAKTSFEKASRELAEAWHKIRPQDSEQRPRYQPSETSRCSRLPKYRFSSIADLKR